MTKRSLAALIVLNAVLLAALVVTATTPKPAHAQFGGRANFLMIAGESTRDSQDAVYIIDVSTGALLPMFYNGSNNQFEIFRPTIIGRDAGTGGRTTR